MTIMERAIAEGLILVDAILEQLVQAPTYNVGAGSTCTPASFTSNGLTACGSAMVGQMGQMIVQQVTSDLARLIELGVS